MAKYKFTGTLTAADTCVGVNAPVMPYRLGNTVRAGARHELQLDASPGGLQALDLSRAYYRAMLGLGRGLRLRPGPGPGLGLGPGLGRGRGLGRGACTACAQRCAPRCGAHRSLEAGDEGQDLERHGVVREDVPARRDCKVVRREAARQLDAGRMGGAAAPLIPLAHRGEHGGLIELRGP
eukprot:scaffold14242_cov55-Phaeocystis_antarctica.AAC.1